MLFLLIMLSTVLVDGRSQSVNLDLPFANSPCLGSLHSEHNLNGASHHFDNKSNKSDWSGAFSQQNRHLSSVRSVSYIRGDCCLIAYSEPNFKGWPRAKLCSPGDYNTLGGIGDLTIPFQAKSFKFFNYACKHKHDCVGSPSPGRIPPAEPSTARESSRAARTKHGPTTAAPAKPTPTSHGEIRLNLVGWF